MLKYKVFLAHPDFIPVLVAIAVLSYLLQFFDFANLSHPNEQTTPPTSEAIRHALTTASTDISSSGQFAIWALAVSLPPFSGVLCYRVRPLPIRSLLGALHLPLPIDLGAYPKAPQGQSLVLEPHVQLLPLPFAVQFNEPVVCSLSSWYTSASCNGTVFPHSAKAVLGNVSTSVFPIV